MEKKKLSTAEILAQARAQKAAAAAGQSAAPSEPAAPAPAGEAPAPEPAAAASAEPAPAGDVPAAPPKPAATPKSTKDILAAARAQKAGAAAGASSEAAPAAPAAAAPKAPAAGGAPKSTKDILAAARAQKAGGAPAAAGATAVAEAAPAAAAKAPAKAPKPATAGAAPSVQEMLKAVREGQAAVAAAPVAKAPITPKIPARPAGKPKPEAAPRRNFLVSLITAPFVLAWMLMTATSLIAVLGAARFMFPNILVEPPSKFKVGPPGDYPGGTVSNKWKDQFAIWVVNAEYQGRNLIYALSTVCTHLGCTPNWLEGEQKFKCPCHGSGFYITGINFEGPAPRPLERYAVSLAPDGMLEIDKSTKFQQEMGQWDDPKSFVEVS